MTTLPAGIHRVRATNTTSAAGVDTIYLTTDGCAHLLVAVQRAGATGPLDVIDVPDCDTARVPAASATIRLLLATPDAGPAVTLGAAGEMWTLPARPFTPTSRIIVPSGPANLQVQRVGLPGVILDIGTVLRDGTSYTVIAAGAGDRTPLLTVLTDGTQPTSAPLGRINTDGGPLNHHISRLLAVQLMLALIVVGIITAGLRERQRARSWLRDLAVVGATLAASVLLAACGAGQDRTSGRGSTTEAPASPQGPSGTQPPRTGGGPFTPTGGPSPTGPLGVPVEVTSTGPGIRIAAGIIPVDPRSTPRLPQILTDPLVGWLEGTAQPGAIGVIGLVGHSTWNGNPGAFADVSRLRPGDDVTISSRADIATVYTVTRIVTFPKSGPPAWLWGPRPLPTLILITCTGALDSTGLHVDNTAVEAIAPD